MDEKCNGCLCERCGVHREGCCWSNVAMRCPVVESVQKCDDFIEKESNHLEGDKYYEWLWSVLADIPMNPETECMEEKFFDFPAGTHREEIWHWFDERHSKGVHFLLYGDEEPREVVEVCPNCESEITMKWDVKKSGYKVTCPECGGRLMLCDECQHSGPGGEYTGGCDYCTETDSCKHNKTE